jgi:hypothetical protein
MNNRSTIWVLCFTVLLLVSMLSFQFGAAFADDRGNIDAGLQVGSNPVPPFPVSPQCGSILLIDDYGDGNAALSAFGYTYTLVSSTTQVAAANLSQYKIIFVAWWQTDEILSSLYARRADLASWINGGGGIIVNAQHGTNGYTFLPEQFVRGSECGDNIEILTPAHPLASGLTGALLSGWGSSSHANFTAWPPAATVVARCTGSSGAHILGMPYGCGRMIVTGTDPEYHSIHGNKLGAWQLMYNELSWACSGMGCPTITSVNPASAAQGQTLNVTITGTKFSGATSVSFGTGVTVNSFNVDSPTQITANISITTAAAPGARDLLVTSPCCTATKIGAFMVIPLIPSAGAGSGSSSAAGATGTYAYSPAVPLANIVAQSASLSAKAVTPGTPVTVTADIANRSTVNGNKKVTLYVNGQVETTQGVTVNSGGSTQLTFNVSRSEPGDYTVYVDGVPAGSFKVELFSANDAILIFSAVLAALAFLIGMVMLWRRQQRPG